MTENVWYRHEDGEAQGPVSVVAIRQKLMTRQLDQSAQVAGSEDGPWHPVGELHAIQDFSSEPDDARFLSEADGVRLAGPVRRWFARMFDMILMQPEVLPHSGLRTHSPARQSGEGIVVLRRVTLTPQADASVGPRRACLSASVDCVLGT